MNTNIYVLSDGTYYYIGKADNFDRRYGSHLTQAFNPQSQDYYYRKSQWIRSYGSIEEANERIYLYEIFEVPYNDWQEIEIETIEAYREEYGPENVMNSKDGGEGFRSGVDHKLAKLNWEIINYIRDHPEMGVTQLANQFFIDTGRVSQIRHNEIWVDDEYQPPERHPYNYGEDHHMAKLCWETVRNIRQMAHRVTAVEMGRQLNLSRRTIGRVLLNRSWYDENWDPETKTYLD